MPAGVTKAGVGKARERGSHARSAMSGILDRQHSVMTGKRNADRSSTQSPSCKQETTITPTPSLPDCESHDTHPSMVTNLPLDILRMIFDYFEAHDIHQAEGPYGGLHRECEEDIHLPTQSDRQKTIRHLRLVCRAFCHLATPMMYSVLRIRPTPRGVRLLQHIAQCPTIAMGVRQLQIYLPYRPAIEARTLGDYINVRARRARSFADDSWPWRVCDCSDSDDDSHDGLEDAALQAWLEIVEDWEKLAVHGLNESPPAPDIELTDHQRIIVKGFAEGDRLRQQEQNLLVDGGFIDALAAAARHMPNIRLLRFQTSSRSRWLDDTTAAEMQWAREVQNMSKTLDKHCLPGEVYQSILMTDSMYLSPTYHETGRQVLPYVKLLWTVPIALFRASVQLEHLHIDLDGWELDLSAVCEPHSLREREGLPNREPVWEEIPRWDEISQACGDLKSLQFRTSLKCNSNSASFGIPPGGPATEQSMKPCARNLLLNAIVARCGPGLRALSLYDDGEAVTSVFRSLDTRKLINLEFLGTHDSLLKPMARFFTFSHTILSGGNFTPFFQGLGPQLRQVHLQDVMSTNGDTMQILHILRTKLCGKAAKVKAETTQGPVGRGSCVKICRPWIRGPWHEGLERYLKGELDWDSVMELVHRPQQS